MKYLNPLTFLTKMNGGPVDLRDNAALSLLRKKMLAEAELSEDKLLKANGQLFSKNDLLQFFDQLQSSQELIYHQQIAADPALLHFLETGEMKGKIADHVLYKDPSFLFFIAPYYEPLFTVAILNSLKNQDVRTMEYLFAGPLLLDGAYTTVSYQRVLRYLGVMDNELKAVVDELNNGGAYIWKYLVRFANPTLIRQLNTLPEEFNKWRSDYGISMINLALAVYMKDFKRGQQVLDLVEQLHTTDHVQERVQVRKKELLDYRKNTLRSRPLETWLGPVIGRFWPRWLNEKRTALIFLSACFAFAIGADIISKFTGGRKPRVTHTLNAEDLFTHSRTATQMKLLIAQLEYTLSRKRMEVTVYDTVPVSPHTGDDVYGPGFMTALKGTAYTAPAQVPKPPADSSAINTGDFTDPLHKQSLRIFNRLEVAMVALLQTPDSFYSCYILPHDSTFLPLQLTANRVYFYAGQHWTMVKESDTSDVIYRAKGYFAENYKNANTFLRDGVLSFVLDSAYWQHSNRYIPVEIGADGTNLFVNLLDNNAEGVDLYLGE
ncbi:hypothetical protein [Chitinophaga sp. RAB17]|uniref:hypothetical protein n=1 Tax=Chitinophaga sp. RAB17 TaxID=3233049 RepID=UPI003F903978